MECSLMCALHENILNVIYFGEDSDIFYQSKNLLGKVKIINKGVKNFKKSLLIIMVYLS